MVKKPALEQNLEIAMRSASDGASLPLSDLRRLDEALLLHPFDGRGLSTPCAAGELRRRGRLLPRRLSVRAAIQASASGALTSRPGSKSHAVQYKTPTNVVMPPV